MIKGKAWGTTELLIETPLFAMHRLVVLPNSWCSWHKHSTKWNAFLVTEGQLLIDVEKNDYALIDTTQLDCDGLTIVKPTEWHRFRTGVLNCVAYEIYYCEPLGEDIIRRDHGGREGMQASVRKTGRAAKKR